MYADDVVLLSHDPRELAAMLLVVDQVALEYGLTINAAKTEIQIQHAARGNPVPMPTVLLSGGEVKVTQDFKYLGSWIQQDWRVDLEVATRRGRALGVFQSFNLQRLGQQEAGAGRKDGCVQQLCGASFPLWGRGLELHCCPYAHA